MSPRLARLSMLLGATLVAHIWTEASSAHASAERRNVIEIKLTSEADNQWHRILQQKAPLQRRVFDAPEMIVNGRPAKVARMKVRGQTCLSLRRNCYGVKLETPVSFHTDDGGRLESTKRFYLISMGVDRGYVSMMMGYQFMKRVGLFPADFQYSEVWINGISEGLYLVVEHPERALIASHDSTYVARRSTSGRISTKKLVKTATRPEKDYLLAYARVRKMHRRYRGERLYIKMKQGWNIDGYLQWLAVNYLVQNGDYDDELFVYARKGTQCGDEPCNDIYFDLMAWDMDDLFRGPHTSEDNYDFAEVDGKEVKTIKLELEESALHSFESEMDREIFDDRFMYRRYKTIAKEMINEVFTEEEIKRIAANTKRKIAPYLDQEHILTASARDWRAKKGGYTKEYINDLIQRRTNKLIKQRKSFLRKLR